MNDTVPNVIVIPAKVETPQEQDKKRHLRVAAYPSTRRRPIMWTGRTQFF